MMLVIQNEWILNEGEIINFPFVPNGEIDKQWLLKYNYELLFFSGNNFNLCIMKIIKNNWIKNSLQ